MATPQPTYNSDTKLKVHRALQLLLARPQHTRSEISDSNSGTTSVSVLESNTATAMPTYMGHTLMSLVLQQWKQVTNVVSVWPLLLQAPLIFVHFSCNVEKI